MSNETSLNYAKNATEKITNGALLTLNEVAALLDVAPETIHKLPLQCIRIGRQYRFDPKDVFSMIDACKVPAFV